MRENQLFPPRTIYSALITELHIYLRDKHSTIGQAAEMFALREVAIQSGTTDEHSHLCLCSILGIPATTTGLYDLSHISACYPTFQIWTLTLPDVSLRQSGASKTDTWLLLIFFPETFLITRSPNLIVHFHFSNSYIMIFKRCKSDFSTYFIRWISPRRKRYITVPQFFQWIVTLRFFLYVHHTVPAPYHRKIRFNDVFHFHQRILVLYLLSSTSLFKQITMSYRTRRPFSNSQAPSASSSLEISPLLGTYNFMNCTWIDNLAIEQDTMLITNLPIDPDKLLQVIQRFEELVGVQLSDDAHRAFEQISVTRSEFKVLSSCSTHFDMQVTLSKKRRFTFWAHEFIGVDPCPLSAYHQLGIPDDSHRRLLHPVVFQPFSSVPIGLNGLCPTIYFYGFS